MRIFLMFFKI